METIISTFGWLLFGALVIAFFAFATACIWGVTFLGYHLTTRQIRERKWWKKAVRESNYKIILTAAETMSHRLGYGATATLQDIINDTTNKLKNR